MAPRKTTIAILATLSAASLALGDDFKTINGKEYKNVTVDRVEPDGIVLMSKSGIAKVYFTELPKEVQERFHYDAAQSAQFTAATRIAISEQNAAIARQQAEAAAEQRQKVEIENRQRAAEQRQQRQAEVEGRERAVEQRERAVQRREQAAQLEKQKQTHQAQAAQAKQLKRLRTQAAQAQQDAQRYRSEVNHMQWQRDMDNIYGR